MTLPSSHSSSNLDSNLNSSPLSTEEASSATLTLGYNLEEVKNKIQQAINQYSQALLEHSSITSESSLAKLEGNSQEGLPWFSYDYSSTAVKTPWIAAGKEVAPSKERLRQALAQLPLLKSKVLALYQEQLTILDKQEHKQSSSANSLQPELKSTEQEASSPSLATNQNLELLQALRKQVFSYLATKAKDISKQELSSFFKQEVVLEEALLLAALEIKISELSSKLTLLQTQTASNSKQSNILQSSLTADSLNTSSISASELAALSSFNLFAISGGPDSIFMLLAAYIAGLKGTVQYIDHQFQAPHILQAWRLLVATYAEELGFAFICDLEPAPQKHKKTSAEREQELKHLSQRMPLESSNTEEKGRRLRMQSFHEVMARNPGYQVYNLYLAHNNSDKREQELLDLLQDKERHPLAKNLSAHALFTFPKKFLPSIEESPSYNFVFNLHRPLLSFPKSYIDQLLQALELPLNHDQMNFDEGFRRNQMRRILFAYPQLANSLAQLSSLRLALAQEEALDFAHQGLHRSQILPSSVQVKKALAKYLSNSEQDKLQLPSFYRYPQLATSLYLNLAQVKAYLESFANSEQSSAKLMALIQHWYLLNSGKGLAASRIKEIITSIYQAQADKNPLLALLFKDVYQEGVTITRSYHHLNLIKNPDLAAILLKEQTLPLLKINPLYLKRALTLLKQDPEQELILFSPDSLTLPLPKEKDLPPMHELSFQEQQQVFNQHSNYYLSQRAAKLLSVLFSTKEHAVTESNSSGAISATKKEALCKEWQELCQSGGYFYLLTNGADFNHLFTLLLSKLKEELQQGNLATLKQALDTQAFTELELRLEKELAKELELERGQINARLNKELATRKVISQLKAILPTIKGKITLELLPF